MGGGDGGFEGGWRGGDGDATSGGGREEGVGGGGCGVGAAEVVELAHGEHVLFGFEGDFAVPGIAHVGLGCRRGGFDFVAVEAFVDGMDSVVEPGDETFEVDEVGLFGDEHAMMSGHMQYAEIEGRGVVVAKEALAQRDLGGGGSGLAFVWR